MNQFDNTSGQDLRNLKAFLDYANSKGSQAVSAKNRSAPYALFSKTVV